MAAATIVERLLVRVARLVAEGKLQAEKERTEST